VAIAGLSIRLYGDQNLDDRFSVDLRRDGFDVVLAREVGNEALSDEGQLAWAAANGRAILTHDRKDFVPIARTWYREGRDHSGVILLAQPGDTSYGRLLRRLRRLLDTLTADDMVNRVEWLDRRWSVDEDDA
jgi:predicted nuclease of predicted toxin-antitoxin system